ncbi:glycosyltransferase family 4 protein [Vibrio sp. 16]|uniref:VpsD family glycosyltransferase n=1 Tax=Vibrio sp. 16 TaxID=391586 RepID=UPI002FEFFEDE
MIKILMIVPLSTLDFGSSTTGGVDSVCQILLKDLIENEYNDCQIRVLAFDPKSKVSSKLSIVSLSNNVDIVHFPSNETIKGVKIPGIVSNFIRIRQVLADFDPDIVHSHLSPWLLGISGRKRVATLHNYKDIGRKPVSTLNDFVYSKLLPWLCDYYVDHYTCVGHLLEMAIKRDHNTSVSLIGNPLNSVYFNSENSYGNNLNITFVTCALLSRKKRIEEAIKIVSRLFTAGINVELIIIGPNVDDQYYQSLHKIVHQENATEYVFFVGAKNTDEIKSIYSKSNFGIFLSSEETFGLAPLEMLASGLPLISTNVGVIQERSEFFTRIGTCIIDPMEEKDALSRVLDFINEPPIVDIEALMTEFSANAVNKRYMSVYKKLLNA